MKIKYLGLTFFLFICFTSCQKENDIFNDFRCPSLANKGDFETVLDAKNNFSLDVPKHWKTELYLNENSSIFTTADTTKQYLNTYLIKATLIESKLNLNSQNIEKIKQSILSDKTVKNHL